MHCQLVYYMLHEGLNHGVSGHYSDVGIWSYSAVGTSQGHRLDLMHHHHNAKPRSKTVEVKGQPQVGGVALKVGSSRLSNILSLVYVMLSL